MNKFVTILSLLVISSCGTTNTIINKDIISTEKPVMDKKVEELKPSPTPIIKDIVESSMPVLDQNPTVISSQDKIILKSGEFENAVHKVTGLVKILSVENKKQLSFENFTTESGPDLYVYLVEDTRGNARESKFVDLGKLSTNSGSFNVNIPDNIDTSKYMSAVIWCKAFSVNFGYARFK